MIIVRSWVVLCISSFFIPT